MATQPFNPDQATPGDTDPIVNFPAAERTFRDVIESWVLAEHGRSGHHTFLFNTTTERDADSTWEAGSLLFNETLNCLQLCYDDSPMSFTNIGFPAGTRLLFQQTTPPTGWTKELNSAYEDAIVIGTTGTAAASGSTAASSVLTARTISVANLPAQSIGVTGGISGTFAGSVGGNTDPAGVSLSYENVTLDANEAEITLCARNLSINLASRAVTGTCSGSISASFVGGATAALGSGTAMDFASKRFTVIIGTRDATLP